MANNGLGRLGDILLLEAVGQSTAKIRSEAHSRLIQAAVIGTAILIGIATLVLGLVTVYIYLRQSIQPLEAAALMSGGLLILSLFLWLTASLLPRRAPKLLQDQAKKQTTASDPAAAIVREVFGMIAEYPVKAGLTALAAGMAIGYSPELRAMLLKALASEKTGNSQRYESLKKDLPLPSP